MSTCNPRVREGRGGEEGGAKEGGRLNGLLVSHGLSSASCICAKVAFWGGNCYT
jgi:hypothetical protein